jgi:isopentenyl diphosphate isomerase/L-lactate dehydrogenase-like FMN-dependent dehydrogenase
MLVGAAERDMSIDLFGMRLSSPIFMSPIGVIGVCAQDGLGDIATAKAARKLRVPMVASTLSNIPLEEVLPSSVIRRASSSYTRLLIVRLQRASSAGRKLQVSRESL